MKQTDIPKKIELGCGQKKPQGFYGVDKVDTPQTDKVIDLDENEWDLPTDYFSKVRAIDLYEHVNDSVNFLEEIYRLCEDGAEVFIRTPHRSSQNWTDGTHKRLAGLDSINFYFTEGGPYSYYSNAVFSQENAKIAFRKRKMLPWNYLVEPLVNISRFTKYFYEETFLSRLFPACNIEFQLKAKK